MKFFAKTMIGVGLLLGSSVCAMADIIWTLNDVYFTFGSDENELTGSFTTNDSVTEVDSFSLDVTGDISSGLFTPEQMVNSYLPDTIGIADATFTDYIDLYLDSPLTSAGGTIDIGSGFDCQGCGTLRVGGDFQPSVTGVAATPEPSAIPFLTVGLLAVGFLVRRRLIRAS